MIRFPDLFQHRQSIYFSPYISRLILLTLSFITSVFRNSAQKSDITYLRLDVQEAQP